METMCQAIFDIMSIINWAREKRGTKTICVMGVSFGALIAGLVSCMEPATDIAVLVAPPVDLGKMFSASKLGRIFEKENPRAERMLRLYNDLLSRAALQNLKPHVLKENIFIAEGIYDGMVPPKLIEELWTEWDRPTIKRYPRGHLSVILFNPALDRDIRVWLRGRREEIVSVQSK